MNESVYYDYLKHIENANDLSGGFVLMGKVPFMRAGQAVKMVMAKFPEMLPKDKPVVLDKQKAFELASVSYYEVQYLKTVLEALHEEQEQVIKRRREEVERLRAIEKPTLKDSIDLSLAEAYLMEAANVDSGLIKAMQVLNVRSFDLAQMCNFRVTPEWRI